MIYRYIQKDNFEDFSSGRVIYQKAGYPNYPVRLAAEIFSRSLEYAGKKEKICFYDPCCGCGYTAVVMGFLFNKKISGIFASDISAEAVMFAKKNLSLLTPAGIEKRKNELNGFIAKYNKDSHRAALQSLDRLKNFCTAEIETECFIADILAADSLRNRKISADIVMTDVPYGNLASWSIDAEGQIDILLETIKPVITAFSVIALSHNKKQKMNNASYKIMETAKAGHRVIDILKLKNASY